MTTSTWIKLLAALGIGIAIGLIYGWLIQPVEFIDTTPETLRADYRADYVLMTAETHHAEKDVNAAARRLAILSSKPPSDIINEALQTGREAGYAPSDLILLQELFSAMQNYQPVSIPAGATP